MWTLSVKGEFSASHRLENHPGKCRQLHGHNYKIEAQFTAFKLRWISPTIIDEQQMVMDFGGTQPLTVPVTDLDGAKQQMVMDFGDAKHLLTELILDRWDHEHLNNLPDFVRYGNHSTTAEVMSQIAYETLREGLRALTRREPTLGAVKLAAVIIWETDTCSVMYAPD